MGFFFGLFKLAYTFLTVLILVDHLEYIYKYFEVFKPETFFSNNQFAHTMGMFLGLLFRISGMLSAMKEKIALSTTYGLFLLLILLLMSRLDFIFYLYLMTAIYAMVFVIVLKFRRAKAKKARSRASRAALVTSGAQPPLNPHSSLSTSAAAAASAPPSQVALDLHGSSRLAGLVPGHTGTMTPSAPPYDHFGGTVQRASAPPSAAAAVAVGGHTPSELYYNPQHNTPPPSYAELYETK